MIFFDTISTIYILTCAFIFGTIFGSAMNCLAIRIVNHEKWGGKSRSKCPHCGHTLGFFDLIPVVSFVILGGKCRYCKEKISPRYLIAELILGVGFVLIALKALMDLSKLGEIGTSAVGLIADTVLNFIFASCVFALSLADMESFEIPDRFIMIPGILRIIYVFLFGQETKIFGTGTGLLTYLENGASGIEALKNSLLTTLDTIIMMVAVFLIFYLFSLFMDKILKKNSLGGGDIKLFAMVGMYLTPAVMLLCVMLSCLIGLVPSVIAMKKAKAENSETEEKSIDAVEAENAPETVEADDSEEEIPEGAFPFGPAVSAAAFICILYGGAIISLYLKLTGLGG